MWLTSSLMTRPGGPARNGLVNEVKFFGLIPKMCSGPMRLPDSQHFVTAEVHASSRNMTQLVYQVREWDLGRAQTDVVILKNH